MRLFVFVHSAGKGRAHKEGDAELPTDDLTPTPVQSLTVEMSIVLEKWQTIALGTTQHIPAPDTIQI